MILSGSELTIINIGSHGEIIEQNKINLNTAKEIQHALQLPNGQLILALRQGGLYILDDLNSPQPSLQKIYSNNDPHRVDELPFNSIRRIITDGISDDIFLCLNDGLGVLKRRFFESVHDLSNGNITSIAGKDDEIYVNMGEVYKVTPTQNGYAAEILDLPTTETIGSLEFFDGKLICATGEGLIYTYGDRLEVLRDLSDRGEGVFYMHGDQKNRLWICQAPSENPIIGIACILPTGQLKEYGRDKGLNDRILVIKETDRGRIYVAGIGENSYLHRYNENEDRFENMSLPMDFNIGDNFEVHDMAIAPNGTIYLASTAGLLRHDIDRVTKIELGTRFNDIEIRSVHATKNGIWLSTETQGMLYHDGEDIIPISEESGLPSKVMSYRGIYNDQNDRLWIGTAEGAVYTLTEGPTLDHTNNPYVVSNNFRSRDTCLVGVVGEELKLVMNTISPTSNAVWYQYALNDDEWSIPSKNKELSVRNITKGNHYLQVRSRINGGFEWSKPISIKLWIKQVWYKNPIIIIPLLFLLIGSIIFSILSSRIKTGKSDGDEDRRFIYEPSPEETERMDILSHIISRLNHGMKWDFVLEELSVSLLRIEEVDAFLICWEGRKDLIIYEGATDNDRLYGTVTKEDLGVLIRNCVNKGKTTFAEKLTEDSLKKGSIFQGYQSVAGMPFRFGPKGKGGIFLMSLDQSDQGHVALLNPLSSYLEQIS